MENTNFSKFYTISDIELTDINGGSPLSDIVGGSTVLTSIVFSIAFTSCPPLAIAAGAVTVAGGLFVIGHGIGEIIRG